MGRGCRFGVFARHYVVADAKSFEEMLSVVTVQFSGAICSISRAIALLEVCWFYIIVRLSGFIQLSSSEPMSFNC